MMIAQLSDREQINVAYTELFTFIMTFPESLRRAWIAGVQRTLEHETNTERIEAIQQYRAMAKRALERHSRKVQKHAHISHDLPEDELFAIHDSLHAELMRFVLVDNCSNDKMNDDFHNTTLVKYRETSLRIDDLYDFAARWGYKFANTDGLE